MPDCRTYVAMDTREPTLFQDRGCSVTLEFPDRGRKWLAAFIESKSMKSMFDVQGHPRVNKGVFGCPWLQKSSLRDPQSTYRQSASLADESVTASITNRRYPRRRSHGSGYLIAKSPAETRSIYFMAMRPPYLLDLARRCTSDLSLWACSGMADLEICSAIPAAALGSPNRKKSDKSAAFPLPSAVRPMRSLPRYSGR